MSGEQLRHSAFAAGAPAITSPCHRYDVNVSGRSGFTIPRAGHVTSSVRTMLIPRSNSSSEASHFTSRRMVGPSPEDSVSASVTVSSDSPVPPSAPASIRPSIVWIQDALRVDDNPALHAAIARGGSVLPVIFDVPDGLQSGRLSASASALSERGSRSMGCTSSELWQHAVKDLQTSLKVRGSNLHILPVAHSPVHAASAIVELCRSTGADTLYMHVTYVAGQQKTQAEVTRACEARGIRAVALWAGTLLDPGQLPFPLERLPENCDDFGEAVRDIDIPNPIPSPDTLPRPPPGFPGSSAAGLLEQALPNHVHDYITGETAALKQLESFVVGQSLLNNLNSLAESIDRAPSRNVRIATVFESLQIQMDLGYLSPRRLYHEVCGRLHRFSPRRFCVQLELYMREYQLYAAFKNGERYALCC